MNPDRSSRDRVPEMIRREFGILRPTFRAAAISVLISENQEAAFLSYERFINDSSFAEPNVKRILLGKRFYAHFMIERRRLVVDLNFRVEDLLEYEKELDLLTLISTLLSLVDAGRLKLNLSIEDLNSYRSVRDNYYESIRLKLKT